MNSIDYQKLTSRKQELESELINPEVLRDPEKVKTYSIEFAKIEKKLANFDRLAELEKSITEAADLINSPDTELASLAGQELVSLKKEKDALESKLSDGGGDFPENAILEIRAGAGGDEASLFAEELFSMYTKFAAKRDWDVALVDEAKNDVGGYKEVVAEINGEDVYRTLRWESGVHRVQRIPETEKTGRIHTSTVSVAILPQARPVDIEILPQDIKLEFFRSSGPGGQNVNKVETAVRIYHLPTGVVVSAQDSRSQLKNREHAMTVLRSKLLDFKIQEEQKKQAADRKQQIGTGDRSEKIRTYNFPQDRVTDHRIKESWHGIPGIMAGNLDPIVTALQQAQNGSKPEKQ